MLIQREKSLLLVVDVQEKLAPSIFEGEMAVRNNVRLLKAAAELSVPAFISEQYVRGLGASLAEIRKAVTVETSTGPAVNAKFFEKIHFSCTAEPGVLAMLQAAKRPQIVLTGMEAHVCVLQTALGLLAVGFQVFLVADATASRTLENRNAAIERARAAGASIVTSEMVLFEWLHKAGSDEFRALLPLIK
ncbi:MAG: hydrolase [Betaproteobacteria bacterium HGW-Betaproteobacteria-10]|nr:MAG: hydrolase [Betaproteobacteria bacterium HGW-Betaproteobacteria-10]